MTPEKIKKLKELTPHVLDTLTRGLIYELIKEVESLNEVLPLVTSAHKQNHDFRKSIEGKLGGFYVGSGAFELNEHVLDVLQQFSEK